MAPGTDNADYSDGASSTDRAGDANRAGDADGAGEIGDAATAHLFARWLVVTGLAYLTCHHIGSLPDGLGPVGATRWADWIDLLTPYLVLLPAAMALRAARVGDRQWAGIAVGAVMYAQGQGIHLSANSIGNLTQTGTAPGDAAHLWDEVVGHLGWYAGAAIVMTVLGTAMRERPRPRRRIVFAGACALALAVGGTWTTNAFGGGTAVPSLLVALALTTYGWRHRHGLAMFLLVAYLPAAIAITGYLGHAIAAQ
jgi:hypothetical protein